MNNVSVLIAALCDSQAKRFGFAAISTVEGLLYQSRSFEIEVIASNEAEGKVLNIAWTPVDKSNSDFQCIRRNRAVRSGRTDIWKASYGPCTIESFIASVFDNINDQETQRTFP